MTEELSDIDTIMQSVGESSNNEIPMQAPEQAPPAPEAPQEFEFQAEGRTYKGDIEKLKKWASQGVGAPNRIGQLSKQLSDYESKVKQYEQSVKQYEHFEETYKPIDEWARQNPEKWQSLFQSWQQQQSNQGQPQLPPELLQKIEAHEERFAKLDQAEQQQRIKQADKGLDGEIESIRKQFSNLDFDAPDEQGNSLEYQILEHATKNGISSFRAAFRDYCFDRLNDMSQTKGREAAGISPKTKAALLGKEPAARRGQDPDLKGRNYDQIHQMILERELGISG